jgi:hypothetical protein
MPRYDSFAASGFRYRMHKNICSEIQFITVYGARNQESFKLAQIPLKQENIIYIQ